jgi:hypothetical protein
MKKKKMMNETYDQAFTNDLLCGTTRCKCELVLCIQTYMAVCSIHIQYSSFSSFFLTAVESSSNCIVSNNLIISW